MFVSDPYETNYPPVDLDTLPITSNDHEIAIVVGNYCDGGADVTISSDEPDIDILPAFKKKLYIKSKILSITDSCRFNYVMIPLKGAEVEISIWVGLKKSDDIWIYVNNIKEY